MLKSLNERMSKARVVRFGGREIIAEGLRLNFWADISHRCMTASWPAFIGGAALIFIAFNAVFAVFYWIGDLPISSMYFWSIRTTICPEAYVHLKISPGQTTHWATRYRFYAR